MSGLIKPKKYDWKDSNLALFGSDTEKEVKREAAGHEVAWKNAGKKVCLQIWRIVKFKVTMWPQEDYGKFYEGDSYIILNTYKPDPKSNELAYNLHFWIGKYSTQDEYGTAAYKTVELDQYLNDAAVQHREVQGYESELFRTYFTAVTYLKGGADTGFRKVTPEIYKPRLLHFQGARKDVKVTERPMKRELVQSGDVYVLDLGNEIYQWNGKTCNKDEKYKAVQYAATMKSERGKATVETIDEQDEQANVMFFEMLSQCESNQPEDTDDESDHPLIDDVQGAHQLFRLSDSGDCMEFSHMKTGDIARDDFQSKDVFIMDTGKDCFVWIGNEASQGEKQNGLTYAHNYLKNSHRAFVPVCVIKEGQHVAMFEAALAA